ncbi:P-loop containing nucleoside triphosphate hydrolase protein [Schizophyllum commune]
MREVLKEKQAGSGVAFEGRIVALRKREGFVHIACPALKRHIQTYITPTHTTGVEEGWRIFGPEDVLGLYFNVSFIINARPLFLMESAAETIGGELALGHDAGSEAASKAKRIKSYAVAAQRSEASSPEDQSGPQRDWPNFARRWLFPEPTDLASTCSISFPRPKTITADEYVDQGLNEEQKIAASSIATHQFSVPYLISGPPGTGKTRTLVECVLQILRLQPEACILLCAPSNPATDTLVMRLRHFLKPSEMLRLNDQYRTFAEVPVEIFSHCRIENEKFAIPPWPELMKFRVVVTTCYDASILVNAQCTNTALAKLEHYVMSALHPTKEVARGVVPHWTHLLIDEAAQGSEPELLIPISVVVPRQQDFPDIKPESNFLFTPQLVLCGDCHQLGPIVASSRARSSELDVSLLERLFLRPLYAEHPLSRGEMDFLKKNYRSHPVILMPPSAMIYNDTLEPCAQNGIVAWAGLPKRDIPLLFIGHEGHEDCVDERSSWFNSGDIQHVVDTVKSLMADSARSVPPLQQREIGVMAPWREQVWKIRERLRKETLHAVDVGTVEDYQGRESRVCIVSCVRSRSRFLAEDQKKGLGLVFERKRMNVALTRAKELLVVVGNGNLLKRDPYWKSFLQFVLRHDLYMGPQLDLEADGNYISRLESRYFSMDEEDEEALGLRIAGELAREILRDEDEEI